MKIGIIIRFHYNKEDKRFIWRLKHFKDNVLPRILKQTYDDFDICIGVNEWQIDLFKKLNIPRLKLFTADWNVRYKNNIWFHDFIKFDDLKGLDKYDLQIGLDSDDYINEDYVKKILEATKEHIKIHPKKSFSCCYQPEYFILNSKQFKPMKTYSRRRGSAFMGLYQPNKDRFIFLYEFSHIIIPRKTDFFKILPKGHCYAVCHELNETTGRELR